MDADKIYTGAYKVSPPRWVIAFCILILLTIDVTLLFSPAEVETLKWLGVAVCTALLIGLAKQLGNKNYLVTLAADQQGLYFQTSTTNKYFFVAWADVGVIEKTLFPLNSRGLQVEIGCNYHFDAARAIGNVKKEHGRCFIYTIPQLRSRDRVIAELEKMRRASRASPETID